MRVARFPAVSPWFRRSLLTEYTDEQLRALEPRLATLAGVTDKSHVLHTARLRIGEQSVEATARTAPEALRRALAKLHEQERVEIVSMFSGPAA